MINGPEEKLGSSKYDGNIRRITLIKKVADMLDMSDGDRIDYFRIGDEIVIRKSSVITIDIDGIFDKNVSMKHKEMLSEAWGMLISEYYRKEETARPSYEDVVTKITSNFPVNERAYLKARFEDMFFAAMGIVGKNMGR